MNPLQYSVKLNITDLDNFNAVAQKMIDASNLVPGCISYDWLICNNDCIINEVYENETAFLNHMDAVGELLPEIMNFCEVDSIDVFTPVGENVIQAFEGMPVRYFAPLFNVINA